MDKKRKLELFDEFLNFVDKKRERRDSDSNTSAAASADWPVEYLDSDESDHEYERKLEEDEGREEVKKEEVVIIEDEIDDEILKLLGEDKSKNTEKSPKIHEELAKRWSNIIKTGMDKDEKSDLLKKYPPIENIPQLVTPKLNPEIEVAMSEAAKKRDKSITNKQQQITGAVSALGGLLSDLISKKVKIDKNTIVETISNTGRILCDLYGSENRLRRFCALEGLNKEMKHSLQQREPGEFLFGSNLCERIKTAKAVVKAGKELKENQKPLNSQGPLRTRRYQSQPYRQRYQGPLNHQGYQGAGRAPTARRYAPGPSTSKRGSRPSPVSRKQLQPGAKPHR